MKKDNHILLRLDSETKKAIQTKLQEMNISLSEFLRQMINKELQIQTN